MAGQEGGALGLEQWAVWMIVESETSVYDLLHTLPQTGKQHGQRHTDMEKPKEVTE